MPLSNLQPAFAPRPYAAPAAQAFVLGWALASEDETAFGAPEDVSDVTDVRISAQLMVLRGQTQPDAVIWTRTGGAILLTTVIVGALTYPYVRLTGTALDAGDYDLRVSLVREDGLDWMLGGVLSVRGLP